MMIDQIIETAKQIVLNDVNRIDLFMIPNIIRRKPHPAVRTVYNLTEIISWMEEMISVVEQHILEL